MNDSKGIVKGGEGDRGRGVYESKEHKTEVILV